MKKGFSAKAWLLIVLVAVMINLPVVHSSWTQWRVERSGTDVTATVTDGGILPPTDDPDYIIAFTFPERIDPDQRRWTAQVDRTTYEQAKASKQIGVRVLEGRPAAYRVDGQVTSSIGLVLTLLADLALVLMVLLAWRYRTRLRPELRMVATGDVERCAPGVHLERLEGDAYLVRGEVAEIAEGEIVLEVGNRRVAVRLDGHANPVGHQQPAQVRGRMIG